MTEFSDRRILTIYMGIQGSINLRIWYADKYEPRPLGKKMTGTCNFSR
jgi:hypothetical protein